MFFKIFSQGDKFLLVIKPGITKLLDLVQVKKYIFQFDMVVAEEGPSIENLLDDFQGTPLASLSDEGDLIIHDADFLRLLSVPTEFPYCTIDEYAALHNRKRSAVYRYCTGSAKNKLPGVIRIGRTWYIPKDLPYPKDGRAGRKMPSKKKSDEEI